MDTSESSPGIGTKIHPVLDDDTYEAFATFCAWKQISHSKATNRMLRFFFKRMSKKDRAEMQAFYDNQEVNSEDDEPLDPLSRSRAA